MVAATEDDYRWLVSEAAEPFLRRAAEAGSSLIGLVKQLRRDISAERAHLIAQQLELRTRASVKFAHADRMFFTPSLLEQATDERVAGYKASRFPEGGSVADLCCGLGGDLIGLAQRGPMVAVDRDPVALVLACANCRACGVKSVTFRLAEASSFDVSECSAWHIDPDRRAGGRRTVQAEWFSPSRSQLEALLGVQPNAAIKLAPATPLPDSWCEAAEREWIGRGRECVQQIAWFGALARYPGRHAVTVLGGAKPSSFTGKPDVVLPDAPQVGRYVFAPHRAVRAAGLVGALGAGAGLLSLSMRSALLTGDELVDDPLLASFQVEEVWPFDVRRLKKELRRRGIGRLEIKARSVTRDPEQLRRRLAVSGDEQRTLVVVRRGRQTLALLTRRISQGQGESP